MQKEASRMRRKKKKEYILTAAEELRPELSRPSEPQIYPTIPCNREISSIELFNF